MGDKILRDIKTPAGTTLSARVLESLLALADFLVSEARTLEGGGEAAKKEAKDQIPSERIKDAPAMARELRWRLRLAAGNLSDDEGLRPRKWTNGNKRKRVLSASPALHDQVEPFKNFKPKVWDSVIEKSTRDEPRVERAPHPGNVENWVEQWINSAHNADDQSENAEVKSRRDVVVKIRRTANGVERQQIERLIEEWTWT